MVPLRTVGVTSRRCSAKVTDDNIIVDEQKVASVLEDHLHVRNIFEGQFDALQAGCEVMRFNESSPPSHLTEADRYLMRLQIQRLTLSKATEIKSAVDRCKDEELPALQRRLYLLDAIYWHVSMASLPGMQRVGVRLLAGSEAIAGRIAGPVGLIVLMCIGMYGTLWWAVWFYARASMPDLSGIMEEE